MSNDVTAAAAAGVAETAASRDRPQSRSAFLGTAIVGGGALAAGAVLAGGLPGAAAPAPSARQDVQILNFFLLIEEVLKAFYADAHRRGALGGELAQFAEVALAHETKHVKWLRKLLKGDARAKPTLEFRDATSNPKKFMTTAMLLEDTIVAAYNGQVPNLTRDARSIPARMVSVDARHSAWMHDLAGMTPAAMSTDKPMGEAAVRKALRRTRFVVADR